MRLSEDEWHREATIGELTESAFVLYRHTIVVRWLPGVAAEGAVIGSELFSSSDVS